MTTMASSNNTMLPYDDLELEMEEVEGLVEISNVGRGRNSGKASKARSTFVGSLEGVCSSKFRAKWGCYTFLVLMVVILTLWLKDTKDLEVTEGAGGTHVSDVNAKNVTQQHVAPEMTPEPSAKPTASPTVSPTAMPTTKVTPFPTVQATVRATPPPSPGEENQQEMKDESTTETETEAPDAKDVPDKAPDDNPDAKDTEVVPGNPELVPQAKESNGEAPKSAPNNSTPNKPSSVHTDYAFPSTPFAVRTENPPGQGVMDKYTQNWGTWQLGDLPKMDRDAFCGDTPHCDVPRDKFPKDAWQADTAFVTKFLDEADKLVDRARNAILAEYGKSPTESEMFDLTYREDLTRRELGPAPLENGGWTTKRSMDGLARRFLHAIMTRDTFTFVMGGHSAAAGHGNHFKQSYTMQVHKILEPVLSYLGVQLISRNLAQGGLGTIQSALGSADIYGDEIDFMVWDSGMTEGRDRKAVDMYGRQALMGKKVPVLWNLNPDLLELYHEHCDADIGLLGTGEMGIPVTQDEVHAETLPYAVQYYTCDQEHGQMCRDHKYMANCWVERPDVTPPTKQMDTPGGQASWHPGFRWHQLVGRILTYTMLTGLKEAIGIWKNSTELPDEVWHVSSYYDNIRNKVRDLDEEIGSCNEYKGDLPIRVCKLPLRGRTEFTPRANPETTSIRSILKTGDYVPSVEGEILYDGPDVRNPMFDIPKGQVDVLAILNNGRKFTSDGDRLRRFVSKEMPSERRQATDEIVPGKGYQLDHPVGYCDGTYNAICRRSADNDCLLLGHHDGRGGLRFNEFSGWIVIDVPKVKEGIIIIKLETWHQPEEVSITDGWTTINNERHLKKEPPEYCDDFHFDYAIDGKITSWDLEEFRKANRSIQRVVEVFTMLDDATYVKKGEEKDVELAIRMRGCGSTKVFSLTHVYWA